MLPALIGPLISILSSQLISTPQQIYSGSEIHQPSLSLCYRPVALLTMSYRISGEITGVKGTGTRDPARGF